MQYRPTGVYVTVPHREVLKDDGKITYASVTSI
jgi:hypothetical protein